MFTYRRLHIMCDCDIMIVRLEELNVFVCKFRSHEAESTQQVADGEGEVFPPIVEIENRRCQESGVGRM